SERDLPANFSFLHIHGHQRPPWRGAARPVRSRQQEGPKHGVGRAGLSAVVAIFVARTCFVVLGPRYSFGISRQIVGVHEQETLLGAESVSVPIHSTDISGNYQRSL